MIRRSLSLALLAMSLSVPALATTVVVPTDFATIQDAVDAAQGTTNGRVVIMSDATFDETVLISESLVLEAAPGYLPTVAGTGTCSGLGGNCTLDISPTAATPQSFTIRGLRLLPPANPTQDEATAPPSQVMVSPTV